MLGLSINMFIHILRFVEGGFYLLTKGNHLQTTIWKKRFYFFQASYSNPSSVFVLSFWVVVVGSLYESWLPLWVRKKNGAPKQRLPQPMLRATCLLEWHFVCLQGRFKLFWDSFTLVSLPWSWHHGSYDILDFQDSKLISRMQSCSPESLPNSGEFIPWKSRGW